MQAFVDAVELDDEHRERLAGVIVQALRDQAALLLLGIQGALRQGVQFAVALLQLQEERLQGLSHTRGVRVGVL